MLVAEPLIAVHPTDDSPAAIAHAAALHRVQYDAVDCLLGRRHPEFGGTEGMIDVIGLNYSPYNQWRPFEPPVAVDPEDQLPLRTLLLDAHGHYGRPLFVAETGCEGDDRALWFDMVMREVSAARGAGVPIEGVCLYPILDHPGWDDDRRCPNGLMCGYSASPRVVHRPLANAIAAWQRLEGAPPVVGYVAPGWRPRPESAHGEGPPAPADVLGAVCAVAG